MSSTDKTPQSAEPTMRKSPWRRWVVAGAAIVAIFVVAGLIGSVVRAHKETQLNTPDGAAGASGLAVPQYGHAAVALTLYEDMRDPATLAFEQTYGPTLRRLVSAGVVDVYYRETAGVDATQGGSGSVQAGNALGCALDAKKFEEYRTVLLKNQPAESDDAFASKSHLISLAKKVKGLDSDVFRACVDNNDHKVWVQDSTKDFAAANLGAVPVLTMTTANAAVGATDSASPSPSASAPAPKVIVSSTQSITARELESIILAAAIKADPATVGLPGATPSPSLTPAPSASASGKSKTRGKAKPSATPTR